MDQYDGTFHVSGVCSIEGQVPVALSDKRTDGKMRCKLKYNHSEIVRRLGAEGVLTVFRGQDVGVSGKIMRDYLDNYSRTWGITLPDNLQDEILSIFMLCNVEMEMKVQFGSYANIECVHMTITKINRRTSIPESVLRQCPGTKKVEELIQQCKESSPRF